MRMERAEAAFMGSGANCEAAQIRTLPLPRSDSDIDHAASEARQISGIVAADPPSLASLNCPFLICSTSSIPPSAASCVPLRYFAQPLC